MSPEPVHLEVLGDPTHCYGEWVEAPLELLNPEAFTDPTVPLYPRCRRRPQEVIDNGWMVFYCCTMHGEEVRNQWPNVMVTPLIA